MKKIPLTRNRVALVDDEDFEELNKHKWTSSSHGYAKRAIFGKTVYMHREILGKVDGLEVDHKNGNGLDNRKENLRRCSRMENVRNQRCTRGGTSKYKGVSWHKIVGMWRATIFKNGRHFQINHFKNEVDAAKAYDVTAKELYGEFARLNFPES